MRHRIRTHWNDIEEISSEMQLKKSDAIELEPTKIDIKEISSEM